ncbi:MAG TPA: TIGR03557 family F420-dependent LLM class oxidoreductase [Gaiellales bacterium]|jgi:coenzyme F420-dependent glucose-6-phosphate dehydrogenase
MPSSAASPLRLGYKASAEQFAPAELLRFALLAEQLEFDSVAISDHFQPFRHRGGHAPSAFPWLGALAARSERVMIGPSVCTPTFRYQPAEVAHAFATLGCLAPGRVFLGVGTGESLNEVPPTGIEWPGGGERLTRLKEAVALIRELWTGERVTFEGDFYKTLRATIYDKPEIPVPIWIAAAAPKSSHYVGEMADGFITTSGKPRTLYTDTLIPAVTAGAESVGRSIADIELMLEVKLSYHPDIEQARSDCAFWAPLALPAEMKQGVDDPIELERIADEHLDLAPSRFICTTDPEDAVEQIAGYYELGFHHLVFHAPGDDQEAFLRRFASDIAPRLRDRLR